MTKNASRQILCLVSMLVLCVGNVFSQSVVNFGTDLYSTKYYESMNAANPPAGEWYAVDYDDSNWVAYTDPMNFPEYDAFWVRRSFIITDDPANHEFRIQLAHDDEASIYVNGQLIHECGSCGRYCYYSVPSSYLVNGPNVLAAYVYDSGGSGQYMECYFSTTDDNSDIILDIPKEPILILSNSAICLYDIENYSEKTITARMIAPTGVVDAQIMWASSNPDVAGVTDGLVTALSVGKTVVTATTTYNDVTYTKNCSVEVREIASGSKVVFVDEPGTLGSLLTDDEKDNVDNLTVFGKLDGSDIQVLRYMAGRNEKGNRTPGTLADLDLYNVEFVSGNNGSFRVNSDYSGYIEAGKLPNYIFRNCSMLNSIVLPQNISSIGSEAFRECSNLESIYIPQTVSVIEYAAFYGCSNMKSFEIPSSVTSIGSELFSNCKKLEYVTFAAGSRLEIISDWAFGSSNLKSITIPASITSIGNYAFYDNNNLTNVSFEEGSKLLEIKSYAFLSCDKIQGIEIPEGCLEIGNNSFSDCYNMTSVTIPTSLVSIGDGAFCNCYSLTELNIPEKSKLASMGTNSLEGTSIRSFYIPKGLISFADIFSNNSQLQYLTVHPENKYYESVGGIVYSKRDKSVVMVPKSIEGYLSFPDYVTTIPDNLLQGCSGLKGIILHSDITSFGENAFSGCAGLQMFMTLSTQPAAVTTTSFNGINKSAVTLVVPEGSADSYRTADGWNGFENIQETGSQPIILLSTNSVMVYGVSYDLARTSTVLATVISKDGISTLPVSWSTSDANVATVADGVIEYVGEGTATVTASVTINDYTATASCSVTSVGMSEGKMVFVSQAGTLSSLLTDAEKDDLTHLIVMGNLNDDDIRVLRYMAGRDEYGNLTVGSLEVLDMGKARIVLGGSEGYYNRDNWWRRVSDNYFGSDIFRECKSLKKVVLPSTLINLGSYAFYGCQNLEEVVLPDGLTSIDNETFRECRKLSKINIPSTVTNLSSWIFYGCISLKSIDLSTMTGVSLIPEYMFYESGLNSVLIPSNITNIGNGAFNNTPLKSVEFERGSRLVTISDNAFQSTQLQTVTIPASVTSINNNAFDGCNKLSEIIYEENNKLTSLGDNVFNGCPIQTFVIPKRLISMGRQDFSEALAQIVVEEGNKFFESIDGVLYSKADNSLVYVPKNKTSLFLPDYVTSFKNGVLQYHHELTTLVLTSTISDLGDSPFCDDYNLREVYCMNPVPPTVHNLYNGWNGMIYIPTGSKKDYEDARWESSMLEERSYTNSVILSESSLTLYGAIGGNRAELSSLVFSNNGPVQNSSVTWESTNTSVVTVDSNGRINYVGPGSAKIIASTRLSGNNYSAECDVTSIAVDDPDNAYYLNGQGNLRSLIGEDNKYNIEKLILIGKMSDDDRYFIREIASNREESGQEVRGSLKYLDMSQLADTIIGGFSGCRSLETVLLPKNITILDNEAFAYCSNLTTLVFPESITELCWGALRACSGIKAIQFLGERAPQLSDYVFGEMRSDFCVIAPSGATGYHSNDYWKDMTNIYETDMLPILVMRNNSVELYNVDEAGANTEQLTAYAITLNGMTTSGISWESSDPTIVMIDENGVVQACGDEGQVVVTASYTDNGKTVTSDCQVSVVDMVGFKFINVAVAGTLSNLLTEEEIFDTKKLIVSGELNNDDICVLRRMAGRDENGNLTVGSLEVLNMSKARIVSGGKEGYYYRDGWWRNVSENYFGSDIFRSCNSLKKVVLPATLMNLGSYAFYGCQNLEEVVLPDGLTNIEYEAFRDCRKLSIINIPSSVTNLSSWIFCGCVSLKSIDLSTMTGVNIIPEYMFYESGLTSINIPAGITNIGNGAFYNTPLKSVVFESDSKLATISDGAFQSTQLQTITIPASVTSINNNAFDNCQKLTEVLYEENNKLTSLGDNVFNGCPIQTFIIPKRLISMGNQSFLESLSEIVVEEGNKFFEIFDGALCSKSEGSLVYVPKNKTSLFLPEYVTSLKNGVLRYHYNLETVVLSSQIFDLGDQPFWEDNSLKEVYCMNAVPPTVRNLSDNWYCDRKIYIPKGSREAYIEAQWDSTLLEERVFEYGITLSTGNMKLYNVNGGNERELSALVFTPAGPAKSEIEWTTSDSSIVSVSNSGVIRYLNEGEAIITASAVFADTVVSAECRVNNLRLDAGSDVYFVTAGNLSTLIPESRKYEIRELILLGEINADDIRFIREMAGIDNNGNKTDGKLARLNLEAVNVVYGGSYYNRFWGTQYNDGNTLGGYAFSDCRSLEEVILPSNLTSLYEGIFYECNNLRYATLPSLINNIPSYTFYNCKLLTNVYIPEKVNYIGYDAFAYCTSLKSVISLCTIPSEMDWSAFDGLTKGNITLLVPSGTYKAYSSKDDWKEFRSITEMDQLPLLILGYNSLNLYNFNTIGAADRTIPATVVTKYGVSDAVVTWNSSNPDAVTVNNGHVAMTTIPGTSVITATAVVDGVTLTASCNVTTNVIDADNAYYVEAGNLPNLIPESQKDSIKKLVLFGELNGTDIRFIRDMAGISEYYWSNPEEGSLEYLDISNAKIVSGGREYGEALYIYNDNGDWSSRWEYTEDDVIGNCMFRKSNSLKTIILPQNIKKIGSYAFDECPKLDEVLNMPSSVTELSSRALYGFDAVYTSNLTPVELENSSLLSDGSVIVVPATSIDAYRTAENWKEFKTQIIPDNIQTTISLNVTAEDGNSGLLTAAGGDENLAYIMDLTLSGTINGYDIAIIRNRMPILRNLDLTNVRIVANPFEYYTDSHTENNRLGSNAFRELDNLRRVVLPNSIDYIGDNAFYECENLLSVKMYEGLNTIDNYVFAYCHKLSDVEMPEGLLSIGYGAFQGCDRLEEITIPSTLLSLGSYAFNSCGSLKSIALPRNLSRIEWETFWYCYNLESVVLPAKVNRIESYAFNGCSKLKELRLPPMIESIGDRAFYDCGNIKDVYVYIANSKDIRIDMNTFSCWKTATLHIPSFSYNSYFWDTQWGQFYSKVEFSETYDEFYTKNTLALNEETGTIQGDPNATLYEQGGLVVEDVEQVLDEVELISDGENGASLIASETGNIKASKLTITIKVRGYEWHFFCFPFDIPLDSIHYDGEYVWRQYDGYARSRRLGGWQDLASGTTKLEKGRGYIFQGTESGNLWFTIENPDLSAKDENTSLFNHPSDDAQDANWNFVGNPYTSYYNIDESTYSAPLTVWTGNGYEAYRPGDDDYHLSPYQAFFVQTSDDADKISFKSGDRESYEEMKDTKASRAPKRLSINPDRLFVNLEIKAQGDSSYTDKTRIVFNNNRSLDYEQNCDAAKFMSDSRSIELYSLDSNGVKYSINERKVDDGVVELGISVNVAGTYSIEAVRMDTPVMLVDNELNVVHDLSNGGYSFSAEKGNASRFDLKLGNTDLTNVPQLNNEIRQESLIFDLQGRESSGTNANEIIIRDGIKVISNY